MHETKEHHGFIYGIFNALTSALMFVFVKILLDVPLTTVVFARFFIGTLLLSPWLFREKLNFSREHLPKHLVRDLTGLASIYCFFYALRAIPLMNAATLSSTTPLFVPLVVLIYLKLMVPKRRILALAIGFAGVLLILQPKVGHFAELGGAFGLLSGLLSAVAVTYVRQLSRVETTSSILLTYFITATVVSLVPMLIFWKPIEGLFNWSCLLAMGIFGTCSQYFLTMSYTHAPASKASLLSYLGVIFGGILGWLIWNEVPTLWSLAGALLIILGGAIALFDKTKPRSVG